jgi:single-strand DNA-binding protein
MSSRSLNRVILIGNLTRDPELKYTPQGTAVCTFGVATNRSWTTQTGETKEDVQFHRLVAWQKLAELCSKILTKGKKVYVEGRITYRNFTGKDGTQKSITEIVLDDFVLFDSARKTEDGQPVKDVEHESHESAEKPEDDILSVTNDMDEKVNPDDIPF